MKVHSWGWHLKYEGAIEFEMVFEYQFTISIPRQRTREKAYIMPNIQGNGKCWILEVCSRCRKPCCFAKSASVGDYQRETSTGSHSPDEMKHLLLEQLPTFLRSRSREMQFGWRRVSWIYRCATTTSLAFWASCSTCVTHSDSSVVTVREWLPNIAGENRVCVAAWDV